MSTVTFVNDSSKQVVVRDSSRSKVTLVVFVLVIYSTNGLMMVSDWTSDANRSSCNVEKNTNSCVESAIQEELHNTLPPLSEDAVLWTIFRCIAILLTYRQFMTLRSIQSGLVLGLTCAFVVICGFLYPLFINTLLVVSHVTRIPTLYILIICDIKKAATFASTVVQPTSYPSQTISKRLKKFGPPLIVDSVLQILVVSLGFGIGMKEIDILCSYTVFAIFINCLVFCTIYPTLLHFFLKYINTTKSGKSHKKINQSQTVPSAKASLPNCFKLLKKILKLVPVDSSWQKGKLFGILILTLVNLYRYKHLLIRLASC